MTDNTELKRLADALIAANDLFNERPQDNDVGDAWSLANDRFTEAASPESILALIAENDRLNAECKKLILLECHGGTAEAAINLIAERDQLKAENELARMRIKELDLLFGRYILAMRSALIEEEHGKGPAAAMEWIYNSLAGPGELPPEGEADSQAYFDREIVAVDNGMQEVMAFHEGRRAAMGKGEQS